MITFILHGELGQLFGEKWELDVISVAEGMRAMFVNTKGKMESYLRDKQREFFFVKDGEYEMDKKEELRGPISSGVVHIGNVIGGSGSTAKIIAGVVLVIIGIILVYTGVGTMVGWMLISMGASLILGGIVEMMTPKPKEREEAASYFFNNGIQQVRQGLPVPIGYGRKIIFGTPISVDSYYRDVKAGPLKSGSLSTTEV
jgi:predicted phage tail protein